jgi:glycosyltransferase involved in cell wall biosynthesis
MAARAPVRILFVHHRSELGGAPASLSYLISSLDRDRFEPHVYCPPGEAAELFRSVGAIVHTGPVSGFTHIWASTYHGRRWLLFGRELLLLRRHVVKFRRTLREQRFDLVHLNDSPLIPAAVMAKRHGIPVVWHLRSALPGEGDDRRSRFVRRVIKRFAAKSIAINEDVARVFSVGSDILPNAVDLHQFRPGDARRAKEALGLSADTPLVAYFGFIYPSKGFREFIQAAATLRDRGYDVNYLVVGGAVRGEAFFRTAVGRALQIADLAENYEREAKQLVQDLGLSDNVHFVPFTKDTAVLYQASDIVVAPSRGPELGRPVIEAAASGVPVIATGSRTGGGVIVPDETGVLVNDFRVDSIVEAAESLLRDPEQRMHLGRAARLHAELTFDPAANAERVSEIYESLQPSRERVPVLYVHHRPQLGGAPSSLAHLIRNLDPRFEPHVLTPDGPAARLFAEAGAVVHTGPSSIFAHPWDNPYAGLRWLVLAREWASLPAHVRQLDSLMRQYRFPVVHLNDSPLVFAAWRAHRHHARVVWHLRSALAGEGRDRRSKLVASVIDRWGDAAIAIDRDVSERFHIELPVSIVHNSVSVPPEIVEPQSARTQLGLPDERILIGFAGFIRRPKGWPEFVSAAELLVREGAPVHFVIMGGGVRPPEYFRTARGRLLAAASVLTDEETAIKELTRTKGVEEHFSFLPFTSDTARVYSALDIVAFPNQGVGLGRPVLEAAMYGKPVVASGSHDGGGVLLDGETGLLLSDPTPRAIADALRTLVDDDALRRRFGLRAAEHARAHFDPVRNARAVESVYDELLGIEPEPDTAEAPTIRRRTRVGT